MTNPVPIQPVREKFTEQVGGSLTPRQDRMLWEATRTFNTFRAEILRAALEEFFQRHDITDPQAPPPGTNETITVRPAASPDGVPTWDVTE